MWNPGKSFSPFYVEGHSPSHMRSIGSWEGVEGASIKITTRIANLNRSGVIATCVHNVSTESRVGQRSIRSEVVVRTHNHTHTHTHTHKQTGPIALSVPLKLSVNIAKLEQ